MYDSKYGCLRKLVYNMLNISREPACELLRRVAIVVTSIALRLEFASSTKHGAIFRSPLMGTAAIATVSPTQRRNM